MKLTVGVREDRKCRVAARSDALFALAGSPLDNWAAAVHDQTRCSVSRRSSYQVKHGCLLYVNWQQRRCLWDWAHRCELFLVPLKHSWNMFIQSCKNLKQFLIMWRPTPYPCIALFQTKRSEQPSVWNHTEKLKCVCLSPSCLFPCVVCAGVSLCFYATSCAVLCLIIQLCPSLFAHAYFMVFSAFAVCLSRCVTSSR